MIGTKRPTLSVAFIVGTMATASVAQDWPTADVRYLLHVSPGGATDVMGRRLSDGLQRRLGQNVIVENHRGGSGARQMAQLQLSRDADHTIGSVTASHLGMFHQSGQFSVDSVEWACRLVLDPYLFAVRADSEFQTLEDVIAKAQTDPGSVTVAGFGEGSGGQIAWLMLEEAAGVSEGHTNWVPYESVGDAVVAVLGGHNDVAAAHIGLVRQHVEAGTMRVLGIMSDERAEAFADVPTLTESGFDVDNTWQQFRGIIMPQGVSADIQNALCSHVEAVLESSELRTFIAESGLIPGYMGPEEFRSFVEAQDAVTQRWAEIIAARN